jgi:hypothetical protein
MTDIAYRFGIAIIYAPVMLGFLAVALMGLQSRGKLAVWTGIQALVLALIWPITVIATALMAHIPCMINR